MNYIIKKCCACGKTGEKEPMPKGYADNFPAKYHGKDMFSHGICDECMLKVYGVEVKGDKTYGRPR